METAASLQMETSRRRGDRQSSAVRRGPACGALRSRSTASRRGVDLQPEELRGHPRLQRGRDWEGGREAISSRGLNVSWRGGESGEQGCGGGASAVWAGPQRHFASTSF